MNISFNKISYFSSETKYIKKFSISQETIFGSIFIFLNFKR